MNRLFQKKKMSGGLNNKHWWITQGMNYSDIIAVYQFKGAENQTEALNDLTPNGYNLTAHDISWDAVNGLKKASSGNDNWVTNSALGTLSANGGIKTMIVRYANYSSNNDNVYLVYLKYGNILKLRMKYSAAGHDNSGSKVVLNGPMGIYRSFSEKDTSSGHLQTITYTSAGQNAPSSGVLACDRNWSMYLDGNNLHAYGGSCSGWGSPGVGGRASNSNNRPLQVTNCTVLAAAFYSKILSDTAHKQIAQMMMTL